MPTRLVCGDRELEIARPQVMGILNVTPDSFSDGGKFQALDDSVRHAEAMVTAGASIIDVGGESTRPGAAAVSEQEELDRVLPVVEALKSRVDAVISVDTSTAKVMREAATAGAGLINDVRALSRDGALKAATEIDLPICIMHMKGQPANMQDAPVYNDVVVEIGRFLVSRTEELVAAGVDASRILIDPGFGFGKTLEHNLQLLNHLDRFASHGFPVLVGVSRKSMIGQILDLPIDQRLIGSVSAAVMAYTKGASIFRVHDVEQTVQALKVAVAITESQ